NFSNLYLDKSLPSPIWGRAREAAGGRKGGGWQLGEGEGKGYRVLVRLELAIDENFQLSIINFQLINFVANKSPCPLQTRICSKQ
ncbi:MAG TPA: hypothetical protein VFE66_06550, partial [Bacteroidales bacterium]|nr:hypothetical protein [Bacteroidales bacterium]